MKKKILLLLTLSFITMTGFAQSNSYLGIKLGGNVVGGYSIDEHFKKSASNIQSDGTYRVKALFDVLNFRVTYTKFTNNKRFGFTGGLRYSFIKAYSTKNEMFMFHDNNVTYYYDVKNVNQKVNYLGIPLDVEFIVTNPEATVRMFFNIGCNFDFKVKSSFDIALSENSSVSSGSVENFKNAIGEPNVFCFSTYIGMGMHIGKPNKVNGTIEFNLPYYGYNNVGIFEGRSGGGLAGSINIPLK